MSYLKRTDVVGKTVIDARGNSMGTVEDIAISLDGRIALSVKKKDGGEEIIDISRIMAIGEYVLLKPEAPQPPRPTPPQPPEGEKRGLPGPFRLPTIIKKEERGQPSGGIPCPRCGYVNKPGSKFCANCGYKLA